MTALYPMLPGLFEDDVAMRKPTIQRVSKCLRGSATSEYATWCAINGFQPDSIGSGGLEAFLVQKDLETRPCDDHAYPGLSHAVQLFMEHFNNYEKTCGFHHNDPHWPQYVCRQMLSNKYAKAFMADNFEIGKTVGDCWTIISALAGAEGCYNRGVYLVQNKDTRDIAVLKLLPTEAVHPNFARREITVLAGLKHPNILQMVQGEFPNTPHDTPWMVTELCDKETLKDMLRKYKAAQTMVPELFVFQIFESLARALKYCHHGNFSSEDWDPISHRDLIPGNCFIKSGRALNSAEYPYTIIAGDFGCAIAKSEYLGRNLTAYDLPFEDQFYIPPGGPTPSEANDVYQLGLLISCFYCLEETPSTDVTNFVNEKWHQGYRTYSVHLRHFIASCLKTDPKHRPTASELVKMLQAKRKVLLANGLLIRVPLIL
jgi:hypothetical protein